MVGAGHRSGRLLGPGKRWRARETGWGTATHHVMDAGESETARSLGQQSGLRPGDRAGRVAKALERSRARRAGLPARTSGLGPWWMLLGWAGLGVVTDADDPATVRCAHATGADDGRIWRAIWAGALATQRRFPQNETPLGRGESSDRRRGCLLLVEQQRCASAGGAWQRRSLAELRSA